VFLDLLLILKIKQNNLKIIDINVRMISIIVVVAFSQRNRKIFEKD